MNTFNHDELRMIRNATASRGDNPAIMPVFRAQYYNLAAKISHEMNDVDSEIAFRSLAAEQSRKIKD